MKSVSLVTGLTNRSPHSTRISGSQLINRRSFPTYKEARLAIFSYLEGLYNPHRRQSSIAYHAPMVYEA